MSARRKILTSVFKLFDLGLMVCAFAIAALTVLRESGGVAMRDLFSMRVTIENLVFFLVFMGAWHVIFALAGLYESRRFSGGYSESVDVIAATSLGTFLMALSSGTFQTKLTTPLFLIVFWVVSTYTTILSRLMLRGILAVVRKHGHNLRNLVIVGTNRRALEFARKIVDRPELGYRVTRFVDQEWAGIEPFRKTDFPLTSDFGDFPQFLRSSVVDEVVLALPVRSMYAEASKIAAVCEEQGITVRALTNIFDSKRSYSRAEESEDEALITHSARCMEGWPVRVKRILDLTISSVLIVLVSPLLVAVAILIKLTSPGPVLFIQKRLGLNKRRFNMCKFRSMVVDAESLMSGIAHLNEASGPVFKIRNDPRITPIGRFLRKTSIDELPQLFNVLIGDMSLVGPRPLPVRDYEGFDKDWQRRRFSVRPGITCLWQVRGRSSINFEQWMKLDLQYIDEWSLWLDFQILMRTIPAVFRGSGAV
jgi:exopolysaccharide biosynthesis polyprenyl glycosylphosphotransferase